MTKSELRQLYLEKRRSLSAAETASMSTAIAGRFFSEIDLLGVSALHTYIRIKERNEIDTSAIYFRLWRDHPGIHTFAPRVNAETGELEAVRFDAGTEMIENAWGITEPAGRAEAFAEEMDIVIVPLLCFDAAGHRVGYGRGYYDRFLARCRPDCVKAGLSLFGPADKIDDTHGGDVPLDAVVTPDAVHRFGPAAASGP
jgi:5-formyltetrahydrofolate cyclo-ligase